MSRAPASCSGRSRNPKVTGSNLDLAVFKPWLNQINDFKIVVRRSRKRGWIHGRLQNRMDKASFTLSQNWVQPSHCPEVIIKNIVKTSGHLCGNRKPSYEPRLCFSCISINFASLCEIFGCKRNLPKIMQCFIFVCPSWVNFKTVWRRNKENFEGGYSILWHQRPDGLVGQHYKDVKSVPTWIWNFTIV